MEGHRFVEPEAHAILLPCGAPSLESGSDVPEPFLPPPHEPPPEADLPTHPRFSLIGTLFAGLVLLAALGFFVNLQLTMPRLARVSLPEPALTLMVSRTMDLEEALALGTPWEQAVYPLLLGTLDDELTQAIVWFQELADYQVEHQEFLENQARVHLRLAILEAEAGRAGRVGQRVDDWARRPDPYPELGRLVAAAYGDHTASAPLTPRALEELRTLLEDHLDPGWFRDRLAWNLAERHRDGALLASARASLEARARSFLREVRWIMVGDVVLLILSTGVLVLFVRARPLGSRRVAAAPLPPPWRGRDGLTVLVRGGAIALMLVILLLIAWSDHVVIRVFALPLASLPLLALARQHLLQPAELGFRTGFGLWPESGRWVPVGLAMAAIFGAGLWGQWGLELGAQAGGISIHWTEWFDEDLVWGSAPVVGVSLVGYVVVAPLFEEIVFRGLLYGTLRRRYRWEWAALLSAALFALAHGYGWFGFASVFWSGLLWAWVYEKTGSLLPGMLAHALNNLMVCFSLMWLLRG